MDIIEFVFSTYHLCTLDYDGLARYLFDMFDTNQSGDMTLDEVHDMVSCLNCADDNDRLETVIKHLEQVSPGPSLTRLLYFGLT